MKIASLLLAAAALGPWSGVQASERKEFSPAERAWWSFQPVRQIIPPDVGNPRWARNPVDHFILAALEKNGLEPAAEAQKNTLVRRLYFDLTGLPPTAEQVQAFVGDTAPDAWENLVARLLDSPHYGERQARLWLDLVRYADSDGYRGDHFRPDAWRYRDYVIDSYNKDKPYPRFISEQIAGDELFPNDPDATVATGYLRHWIYEWNNRDVEGQRSVILNDITDTTADVFMGLGLQCARCHDHKFDPLLQVDYYRLQAFFEPLVFPESTPAATPAEVAAYQAALLPWEQATASLRERIATLQAEAIAAGREKAEALFPSQTRSILHKPAPERSPLEQQVAVLAQRQIETEGANLAPKITGSAKQDLTALQKELSQFNHLLPPPLPSAAAAIDVGPVAPPTLIPRREENGPVLPGLPTLLNPEPTPVTALAHSTGRRSALAKWLSDSQNPLTARVMVNRIWQQHFGKGLSTTTSDFGTLGDPPSHPELLDWLAHRFMEDGWSIKKLHRLILTSATWKQGHISAHQNAAMKLDPENRLLWRWSTRRLEAEQIRDAIFHATGELDLTTGGPPVDSTKPRRAIYTKILRNVRDPLMDQFDAPQYFQSTASRDSTTTATQSLFLANSRFMSERADAMASSLTALPDAAAQIDAAWWRTTGRAPSPAEKAKALAFLEAAVPHGTAAGAPGDPESFVMEPMPQRSGKAAVFTPGSSQEHLAADAPPVPQGDFSVESVALLQSVFPTGAVRTIAGQWSGDQMEPGWALGVTGKTSRRQPQMPVFLLCGPDQEGKLTHDPVFSGFQLQLGRSYYIGVSFKAATTEATGLVTFYIKDLANDDEPLLINSIPHKITALTPPEGPLFIGSSSRDVQTIWDGLIDEIRITRGTLAETTLSLLRPDPDPQTMACWKFEPGRFRHDELGRPDSIHVPFKAPSASPGHLALADLCHALLSSSDLLYLD